jgi:hypothetical protein
MGRKKSLTPLGQEILDTILDRVVRDIGMGFFAWSIGGTVPITAYVARKLKLPQKTVDGGLAHLIHSGYFSNELETDGEGIEVPYQLAVQHKGWEAYSRWNVAAALEHTGCESLETWREWDYLDGMPYPFDYKLPKWTGK